MQCSKCLHFKKSTCKVVVKKYGVNFRLRRNFFVCNKPISLENLLNVKLLNVAETSAFLKNVHDYGHD